VREAELIKRASIAAFLATPLLGILLGAAGPADGGSAAEQRREGRVRFVPLGQIRFR
jgi:hypothetical protein